MKRLHIQIAILLFCSSAVFAQFTEESPAVEDTAFFSPNSIEENGANSFYGRMNLQKSLHPGIPLLEVLFQDYFVWYYDRYIIDKHYAQVNLHIWKRNFKEGWKWDDNDFGINFFGHPYQGSFYYTAARSAGYGFYESFLYTLTGSYVWEMLCEREYPAPNDLITTSIGGATYGEILYRLSQRFLAKPNPTILDESRAFVLSPLAYGQGKVIGYREHNPGYAPIDFSVRAGGGLRFGNDYRYDEDVKDRNNSDWNEESAFVGFNLVYGRPNRKIHEPFEYFTVDFTQDYGHDGMLFHLETTGKLKNINMNSGKNWMDLGTYLHFDTFYGDLAEMGVNSIGLGADVNIWLNEYFRFRMTQMPSFVLLGSSDFNYDDVLAKKDADYEVTRTYQFSTGVSYKMTYELELANWGLFKNSTAAYLFKTMPHSEPHYGMKGYDLVAFNSANLEFYIPWNCRIGARLESYLKVAAYEEVEPMSRRMHSISLYLRYIL